MINQESDTTSEMQLLEKHKENISFEPIFIIGDHRSGTTLLYKLLTMSGKINYISSYDVIKYDEILSNYFSKKDEEAKNKINDYLLSKGIVNRGLDSLEANANLPEEYGFILNNKSKTSHVTEDNYMILKEICQKVSIINPENSLILLKNPYDYNNISFLRSIFPKSRFILTTRNPKSVAKSKRNAVISLFSSFNYYTAMLSELYSEYFNNKAVRYYMIFYYSKFNIFARLKTYFDCISTQKKILEFADKSEDKVFYATTYEKICDDANSEINAINIFLGIGKQNIDYSSIISN